MAVSLWRVLATKQCDCGQSRIGSRTTICKHKHWVHILLTSIDNNIIMPLLGDEAMKLRTKEDEKCSYTSRAQGWVFALFLWNNNSIILSRLGDCKRKRAGNGSCMVQFTGARNGSIKNLVCVIAVSFCHGRAIRWWDCQRKRVSSRACMLWFASTSIGFIHLWCQVITKPL